MAKLLFNYKGEKTKIECNINDSMKEIIDKYLFKIKTKKNLCFRYNGNKIDENLKFFEQANEKEKKWKY